MELKSFKELPKHSVNLIKETERRYIDPFKIYSILEQLSTAFSLEDIGKSVNAVPIKKLTWGKGDTKVMIWSQMHGNESTTTRALVNLIFLIDRHPSVFAKLYENLQLIIIPIVNPDGALKFQRNNANNVDLNRDAISLGQPESRLLMNTYQAHQPDMCLNLHDQRSIFGVNANPAGLSFLAPSFNKEQSLNQNRKQSMSVIAEVAEHLNHYGLKGHIGRYDETFNEHCFGDFFQKQGTPTILVEAGQLLLDYERNKSVYHCMLSYYLLLRAIVDRKFSDEKVKLYYQLPVNQKLYYDLMIKNVKVNDGHFHLYYTYDVEVHNDKLCYRPRTSHVSRRLNPAHRVIDAGFNYLEGSYGEPLHYLNKNEYLSDIKINSVNYSLF
jgi:hypothetical protein